MEALVVRRGPWAVPVLTREGSGGHIGLLVGEGMLVRSVGLPGRAGAELLGPGDIIRPWENGDPIASLPSALTWTVLEPARLAVLDRRFVASVCEWPEVVAAIAARTVHRSQRLAFQLAISHLTRVDARLLAFFWRCADRWGHVTPEGVVLRMRVTHELLAKLVGVQRPSVTTALKHLSRRRAVVRRPDGSWLLQGEPPDIEALLRGAASEAVATG